MSTTLVKSAEMNFTTNIENKTNKTNTNKKSKQIKFVNKSFSNELKEAYKAHKIICNDWRKAGRPSDKLNQIHLKRQKLILKKISKILGGMRIRIKHMKCIMN